MAHTFPDAVLNTSLLSITQLCQMGYTATFTSDAVHVAHNECTVLHASKLPTDHLWPIATPTVPLSTPTANAAHALPLNAEFVKFTNAALSSPAVVQ